MKEYFLLAGIASLLLSGAAGSTSNTVKDRKALAIDLSLFKTNRGFAIGSFCICAIIATLYTIFW